MTVAIGPEGGLFRRLVEAAGSDWPAYRDHAFVRAMADGSLPEAAFRHYLVQDYLFLIHFARAYALAVYKAETLAEMRRAAATVQALLDHEMSLHVGWCAEWGLDEAAMAASEEDGPTLAYTRYVLERGMAGDLLDLQVALAPCVVGYGEVARAWGDRAAAAGSPYRAWFEMYGGDAYQQLAAESAAALDPLFDRRGGEQRFADLARTFRHATRLEAAFWQMGLDRAG